MTPTRINFTDDLMNIISEELTSKGYPLPKRDPFTLLRKFINLQRRMIPIAPRKVHESKELQRELSPSLKNAYHSIKIQAQEGQNLNPYLSKNLWDIDYEDALLNDWGIHHLHLAEVSEGTFFSGRTQELLFVMVRDQDIYFVDILKHGKWAEKDLIEIIHTTWPALLANYTLKGVLLSEDRTEEERLLLRKKGVSTPTKVKDGTIYASPGGGYASSGVSIWATMQADKYLWKLKAYEQWVRDNIPLLQKQIQEKRGHVPGELIFKLHLENEKFYTLEAISKVAFLLGD